MLNVIMLSVVALHLQWPTVPQNRTQKHFIQYYGGCRALLLTCLGHIEGLDKPHLVS